MKKKWKKPLGVVFFCQPQVVLGYICNCKPRICMRDVVVVVVMVVVVVVVMQYL